MNNIEKETEAVKLSDKSELKKKTLSFEKISYWIIGAILFLMPVFVFPNFVAPVHPMKTTLFFGGVFAAAAFWLFGFFKKGSIKFTGNVLYFVFGLMLAACFVFLLIKRWQFFFWQDKQHRNIFHAFGDGVIYVSCVKSF